jgi:hypothetical protein
MTGVRLALIGSFVVALAVACGGRTALDASENADAEGDGMRDAQPRDGHGGSGGTAGSSGSGGIAGAAGAAGSGGLGGSGGSAGIGGSSGSAGIGGSGGSAGIGGSGGSAGIGGSGGSSGSGGTVGSGGSAGSKGSSGSGGIGGSGGSAEDGGKDSTVDSSPADRITPDIKLIDGSDETFYFDGGPDVVHDSTVPPDAPNWDAVVGDGCSGLECAVKACGTPSGTTISGTVYAPNGELPLYGVTVYIPNGPLPTFTPGAQCDVCGSPLGGSPVTSAVSDQNGNFRLVNAPSGVAIPIVVQLGKWQRKAIVPSVTACTANALVDPNLTRLPRTQTEGNMPHIALTTGGCDYVGCILPKLGIDPSEFGYQSDGYAKAVNTYYGGGASAFGAATKADSLWSSPSLLATYDMAIFSCECSESLSTKGGTETAAEFANVTSYLNAGGRVFTSDFQYTWYKYSPDPKIGGTPIGSDTIGIGEIMGNAPTGSDPVTIDTSTSLGLTLAQWLKNAYPASTYASFKADFVFANIQYLNTETQPYAYSSTPPPGTSIEPRIFTLNTPVGSSSQCGQAIHIDAHTDQTTGDSVGCTGGKCYPKTCSSLLNEGEGTFAFYFFQMSACIP